MHIQTIATRRVLVTISENELHGYGVEFATMGLSDTPTRVMLSDMLTVIEHMGIRSAGDRVTVECAQGQHGGCTLVFEINSGTDGRYIFESSDDFIAAARAGALPVSYDLAREPDQLSIIVSEKLQENQDLFLREFTAEQDRAQ